MKYIVLIMSLMMISGAYLSADEAGVKQFARKLREREVRRWDQERFYGQLHKVKKVAEKTGPYNILQFFQQRKTNNQ